jgi:MinD-like ATPase involved in chromosome partitioning or flagellar assembly
VTDTFDTDRPADAASEGATADAATVALVGSVGGAGTTRTTVELAATLARDGGAVAVLDAAYATQGLVDYLPDRIDPDLTALVTDRADDPLDAGLVDLPLPDRVPGRVACLPVRAPFERVARAKTETAARSLADRIAAAGERFDAVLVDTPPVAANQSVAAVTAAERVVAVTPATPRGRDALARTGDRLADLGAAPDATIAVSGPGATAATAATDGGAVPDADAVLPESPATPGEVPTAVDDDGLAAAVADAAASAVGVEPDLALGDERLVDGIGERVGSALGR